MGLCLLEGNTRWIVIISKGGMREAVRMVGQGDCALDESTYSGMDRIEALGFGRVGPLCSRDYRSLWR